MRRETKLNLAFLAMFMLLSLPGAVILFKKKLAPGARPIFMSDTIDRRVPYMSPTEPPPGYRRVIPSLTAQWLDSLVQARHAGSRTLMSNDARGNPQPIVSQDHQFQLVWLAREESLIRLSVIDWSIVPPGIEKLTVTLRADQNSIPAQIIRADKIDLPAAVKTELINLGLPRIPNSITWIDAAFQQPTFVAKELILGGTGESNSARQIRLRLP